MSPREELRDALLTAIRSACPTDEQCLADEDECMTRHPVHEAGGVNDVINLVYAEVNGLVDLILDTIEKEGARFLERRQREEAEQLGQEALEALKDFQTQRAQGRLLRPLDDELGHWEVFRNPPDKT